MKQRQKQTRCIYPCRPMGTVASLLEKHYNVSCSAVICREIKELIEREEK